MTDANTTLTQTTVYLVQFKGNASGKWVDAAVEPYDTVDQAQAWINQCIPDHQARIIKRTTTDEVVSETEA